MRITLCLALIGITLSALGACATRRAQPTPQPLQAAAGQGEESKPPAATQAHETLSGGAPATAGALPVPAVPAAALPAPGASATALPVVALAVAPSAGAPMRARVRPSSGSRSAGTSLTAGNGAAAHEVPDGSDDDIIARRLRRAAESEVDPELRGKLWKEYVDYRDHTQR